MPSEEPLVNAALADRPVVTVLSEEPLVLIIDRALPEPEVAELVRSISELEASSEGSQTTTYVDDIFDAGNRAADDEHFLHCVAKAGVDVPCEYSSDPLRSFLWLAAHSPHEVATLDLAASVFMVEKRAFVSKWEAEPRGRRLVADSRFHHAATRLKMPEQVLRRLAPLVFDVLGCGVSCIPGSEPLTGEVQWELHDATVVRYRGRQSQVPHMDTADMTLLTYLSDTGGSTCFPNLGLKVPPKAGRVLLFFSTRTDSPSLQRSGELPVWDTLHYGELVEHEDSSKLVAQILISASNLGQVRKWRDTLCGRFFSRGVPEASPWPCRMQSPSWQPPPPPSIALCEETCSFCSEKALELETQGRKFCLTCWTTSLKEMLNERSGS